MNNDQEEQSSKFPDTLDLAELISGGQAGFAREYEQGDMIAGRYKVLSLVGRGAMGAVYAVEHVFMKKVFALKTLTSSLASGISQRRFHKEAQAASQLDHPNLARAVDFGADDGRLFLVMDFVEGQPLSEHLKLRRLSVEEALNIFIPVCFALDHAHQHGVIHRDIKPSNIVLAKTDGRTAFIPKIVDFGIAKLAEDAETEALTRTGEVFGTPLYMSPEQCAGIKVDQRSDIYSLGCVLYESLTGTPPFAGQTALETMMQHRTEPVLAMEEASLGLNFPPALEGIVRKILAKEPEDRYQNCLVLAEDLMRVQRGEAVDLAGLSINSAARAGVFVPGSPGSKFVATLGSLPLVVVLIAVVGLIAILSSFFLLRPHEQPKETAPEPAATVAEGPLCTGDRVHGITFHFGKLPTDPNYTYNSYIIYDVGQGGVSVKAKGNVAVPAGAQIIQFDASQTVVPLNTTLFRHFRPDCIDNLTFSFAEIVRAGEGIEPDSFNDGMSYVGTLKGLKAMTFCNAPLNSNGLSHLKLDRMRLYKLALVGTALDGSDLIRYKFLPKLSVLEFSNCNNTTAVIKALRHSTDIRGLTLRNDHLSNDDLGLIGSLPLAYLDIRDNHEITIAGLSKLKQKRLHLALDGQQFAPDLLASMSQLSLLDVGIVDWTQERKDHLRQSLPKCEIIFERKD